MQLLPSQYDFILKTASLNTLLQSRLLPGKEYWTLSRHDPVSIGKYMLEWLAVSILWLPVTQST